MQQSSTSPWIFKEGTKLLRLPGLLSEELGFLGTAKELRRDFCSSSKDIHSISSSSQSLQERIEEVAAQVSRATKDKTQGGGGWGVAERSEEIHRHQWSYDTVSRIYRGGDMLCGVNKSTFASQTLSALVSKDYQRMGMQCVHTSSIIMNDDDHNDDGSNQKKTVRRRRKKSASQDGGKSESESGHGGELAAADDEPFSAITDKIPQRPMTVVEGTSYTLVIIAALGFAAAVLYAALSELVFSPKEYTCYSNALKRIEDDPRVTIRLGTPLSAYGTESRNRSARQRIPHRMYNDEEGREHVQLQFHAKGPSGRATVHADMYQEDGSWKYHYLYLNVESPLQQQVVLIRPFQPDNE